MTALRPAYDSPAPKARRIRKTGVIRPVGPYSKDAVLGRLDGRTREARGLAAFRAELLEHIGGRPTAPQRRLIDLAAQLWLRIALMDDRFAATGTVGDMEGRAYLAWANTLARVLVALGVGPPAKADPLPPTLRDYLAARELRPGALALSGPEDGRG